MFVKNERQNRIKAIEGHHAQQANNVTLMFRLGVIF